MSAPAAGWSKDLPAADGFGRPFATVPDTRCAHRRTGAQRAWNSQAPHRLLAEVVRTPDGRWICRVRRADGTMAQRGGVCTRVRGANGVLIDWFDAQREAA